MYNRHFPTLSDHHHCCAHRCRSICVHCWTTITLCDICGGPSVSKPHFSNLKPLWEQLIRLQFNFKIHELTLVQPSNNLIASTFEKGNLQNRIVSLGWVKNQVVRAPSEQICRPVCMDVYMCHWLAPCSLHTCVCTRSTYFCMQVEVYVHVRIVVPCTYCM